MQPKLTKSVVAGRFSRQDRSISKEIESQRIAQKVANDVRKILRDDQPDPPKVNEEETKESAE